MIESFEIQNYRLFRHLKIEKLGRVNLITGKNNVGKTALLEATHLFSSFKKLESIKLILNIREELITSQMDLCVLKLFNHPLDNSQKGIKISDNNNTLSIETILFVEDWNEDRTIMLRRIVNTEKDTNLPTRRGIKINFYNISKIYPLDQQLFNGDIYLSDYALYPIIMKPCLFVFSSGLGSVNFLLWDKIALTTFKNDLIKTLNLISPEIEDIAVTSHPELKGKRQFMCKIINMNEPELLTSMGEGTKRLLDIILALINTQGGVLLIDEIENGIHYSIHQRLWEIIFDLAEKLNVQVFATTHSWDCIDGFQRALNTFPDPSQGLLLRLSKLNDDIISTSLDARELTIAIRENIEVR